MKKSGVALILLVLCLVPQGLRASDHADPTSLDSELTKEPNITGLFVFPDGDNLVVILNVYRSLVTDPPYNLSPYEYSVYMDLHSQVNYDSAEMRARYGGEVVEPTGIKADVTITFHLNDDTTLKDKKIEGLKNPESIRIWTGLRDDPFIFPRFFKKNVISMVMSIPYSSFPEGQLDWLFWGTTKNVRDGQQIDHVGRSARTQLPRFGFLNTVAPDQHVAEIDKRYKKGNKFQKFLMNYVAPATDLYKYTFEIRHYDLQPDVMIYTTRFPSGYPNGRRLPDDIVGLTCAQGDCILQELSYIDVTTWQRPVINDKTFLSEFPYMADPWTDLPPPPDDKGIPWLKIILTVILILLVIWFLRWWFNKRHLKKHPHGDSQPATG